MIIDYSFWRPSPAELRNVNGVIRYLSHDQAKCVSLEELRTLHNFGIGTALVFEDTANRASTGYAAGEEDGKFTRALMSNLGVPRGRPVFIAVDFDIPDYAPTSNNPETKLGPVAHYLSGFDLALKDDYEIAVYGGYWLVSRALNADLVSRAWQTIAWSGDKVDPRVCLFQPGQKLAGGNADLDFAGWRDWGQFRHVSEDLIGASA